MLILAQNYSDLLDKQTGLISYTVYLGVQINPLIVDGLLHLQDAFSSSTSQYLQQYHQLNLSQIEEDPFQECIIG